MKKCPKCKTTKPIDEFNSQGKYCLSCHRENSRLWRANNAEKNRESQKKYNIKTGYSRMYAYKQTDAGKIVNRRKSKAYRSRKAGAIGSHTTEEWYEVLAEYNFKCAICGSTENLTEDHIVPLSRGGSDYIENIQPLCSRCNASKNNKVG